MKTTKLTAKQKLFIEHYLSNGFNATQAAISAGYSEKTAYSIGNENLSKPEIKEAIEKVQQETVKKINVTKESLILDLIKIKDTCIDDKRYIHNSIKATETINKMLGYNEPDVVNTHITGNVKLSDLIKFDDGKSAS